MENPLFRRKRLLGSGHHGNKSEKRTAKRLSAKLQPYSGNKPNARADMTLARFLIEAKSTTAGSLRLPLDWLCKIAGEARRANRSPAMSISFVTGDGRERTDGTWVMMPESIFKELVDAAGIREHEDT